MENTDILRLGFFVGVFSLVAIGELLAPRRALITPKARRWARNLTLILMNPLVVRLLFPVLATGLAVTASEQGWGLLNNLGIPRWAAMVIGIVLLDLVIYLQHVMFHAVPVLWRLHMVHHADLDFDVTTGLRFHPIEILVSMGIKLAAVAVLGPPVMAVVIFEVVLNGMAMFNHSNLRVPLPMDRILRLIVVTPDMHRVHHSVFPQETNTNFGFNFSWWDRLLGTYRDQPTKGHGGMTIGLHQYSAPLSLPRLLALPFIGKTGNYAISQRGKTATKP
jgi:sterol desaturase/sphingolipid hydroxylase (fatty acid hydroxylase superfamily)